jgi:hypothetical protein
VISDGRATLSFPVRAQSLLFVSTLRRTHHGTGEVLGFGVLHSLL